MRHWDYTWDLYPNYLILDQALNTDVLGWKEGDLFRLTTDSTTGIKMIKKVNAVEKFTRGFD